MIRIESYVKEKCKCKIIDQIILKYQDRYLRKKVLNSKKNKIFINFKNAVYLSHNSYLITEDHKAIKVVAQKEKIIQININDPVKRCEVAWHIGNRHLAAEVGTKSICILFDPVIWKMLINLGYKVSKVKKVFEPLGGAYDHQH
jgi:urease accessory protein